MALTSQTLQIFCPLPPGRLLTARSRIHMMDPAVSHAKHTIWNVKHIAEPLPMYRSSLPNIYRFARTLCSTQPRPHQLHCKRRLNIFCFTSTIFQNHNSLLFNMRERAQKKGRKKVMYERWLIRIAHRTRHKFITCNVFRCTGPLLSSVE